MSTKYQMYFTWNAEKEKIQLPVLPEEIRIKNLSNNESMNVTDLGEVVVMQSPPAEVVSFSSFFPASTFPGIQVSSITKPQTLIEKILTWKSSTTPIHFICTALNIDDYYTIEEFNYSEVGGDPGTYQYDIELKQYKEISTRQVTVSTKTNVATVQKTSTRTESSSTPQTYTVKDGDCLWNIAKKFYGSGSKYTIIYDANKDVIEKTAKKYGYSSSNGGNWIFTGTVLTIPAQ